MSQVQIQTNASGTGVLTISSPNTNNNYTATLPAATDTLATLTQANAYNAFKNRIINGAMVIDQKNAGASVVGLAGDQYITDRWFISGTKATRITASQSTTTTTGFINSLLVTSTATTTANTAEQYRIEQKIEGLNVSDLAWGTASAATVTLSFWVRSSLTGTFGGAIVNSAANRSYPFPFTISTANAFEQKTITITGDTSGTWLANNSTGISVRFNLGCGSSFQGTANAWAAANYIAPTGSVSVVGTNAATFYITGVQLEKGSTATSFDYRPYGTELALCQRYAYGIANYPMTAAWNASNAYGGQVIFPVTMRVTPTLISGTYAVGSGVAGTMAFYTLPAGTPPNGTNGVQLWNSTNNWSVGTVLSIVSAFFSSEL